MRAPWQRRGGAADPRRAAENTFQLCAALVASVLFTSFVAFESAEPSDFGPRWRQSRFYVLLAKAAFQLLYLLLAIPVISSFSFRVYKLVGADSRLQTAYRRYLAFLSTLKLDACAAVFMIVLAAFTVRENFLEGGEQVAALLLTLAVSLIGFVGVVKERASLCVLFAASLPLLPAFIGFKLFQMFGPDHRHLLPQPERTGRGQFRPRLIQVGLG